MIKPVLIMSIFSTLVPRFSTSSLRLLLFVPSAAKTPQADTQSLSYIYALHVHTILDINIVFLTIFNPLMSFTLVFDIEKTMAQS